MMWFAHANAPIAVGLSLLIGCRSEDTAPRSTIDAASHEAPGDAAVADTTPRAQPQSPLREIRFAFHPSNGPETCYQTQSPEDQHRLVLLPGVSAGGSYPVVIGMHGQPKRGQSPRSYEFGPTVTREAVSMVETGEAQPFGLALPVFRFVGENWPGFDLSEFRVKVDELLAEHDVSANGYYAFGHSGAAGCGGDGLNRAVRLSPKGVGFIDTCVGASFGRSVRELHSKKIPTIIIHSVETAGFAVRQKTEYSSSFDFGRVYEPLGLSPCDCPTGGVPHRLRNQAYRCAATGDGTVSAFVVDTGEGLTAHAEALRVGARYFFRTMLKGN
jgi:hypothetical protein